MARAIDRVKRAAIEKAVREGYPVTAEDRSKAVKFIRDIMDNEHVGRNGAPAYRDVTRAIGTWVQMEKLLLDRIKLYTELEIDFLDDEEEELPREEALFLRRGLQKLKAVNMLQDAFQEQLRKTQRAINESLAKEDPACVLGLVRRLVPMWLRSRATARSTSGHARPSDHPKVIGGLGHTSPDAGRAKPRREPNGFKSG